MYKPVQFQASPDAEMLGVVYLGMADNLMAEESQAILSEYGITNVVGDQWYPHQLSLDVAKAIHEGPNGKSILVAMGRGIGQTAALPEGINTLEDFFAAVPYLYQANIRNQHPDEHFKIEKIDKNRYRFINNTPSSNQLTYGLVWEFVKRFGGGKHFVIAPISGMEHEAVDGAIFEIRIDDE